MILYNNSAKRTALKEKAFEFTKLYNWKKQKLQYFELMDSLVKGNELPESTHGYI